MDLIDISLSYPQQTEGQLKSVTEALGRTVIFEYDDAVRVNKQILPDGREIGFSYDDAGNVTQVIPPGRPPHAFTYTAVNLEQTYAPPQLTLPLATVTTTATYTADGQVDLITRPDSKQIDFAYEGNSKTPTRDRLSGQPGEGVFAGQGNSNGSLRRISNTLTRDRNSANSKTPTFGGPTKNSAVARTRLASPP